VSHFDLWEGQVPQIHSIPLAGKFEEGSGWNGTPCSTTIRVEQDRRFWIKIWASDRQGFIQTRECRRRVGSHQYVGYCCGKWLVPENTITVI